MSAANKFKSEQRLKLRTFVGTCHMPCRMCHMTLCKYEICELIEMSLRCIYHKNGFLLFLDLNKQLARRHPLMQQYATWDLPSCGKYVTLWNNIASHVCTPWRVNTKSVSKLVASEVRNVASICCSHRGTPLAPDMIACQISCSTATCNTALQQHCGSCCSNAPVAAKNMLSQRLD